MHGDLAWIGLAANGAKFWGVARDPREKSAIPVWFLYGITPRIVAQVLQLTLVVSYEVRLPYIAV